MVDRLDLQPFPTDPRKTEQHILVTVRPNDTAAAYLSRRSLGWILQLEQLAAQTDDERIKAETLKQLLRFYFLSLPKDRKPKGPQELHLHQHQHHEGPDLSKIPAHELKELTQAFSAHVNAGNTQKKPEMTRAEKRTYDLLTSSDYQYQDETDDGDTTETDNGS